MFISREKIRKHRHWWLFFGVWLPLTILAFLWFGFSPDGTEQADGVTFEVQYGKLNAHNNMSTSANTGFINPSYFADRHITIINHSDHTFMKRVGGLVLEQLKQQPSLERIDYYPLGESLPQEERAPDIFVTLDLENLEESGLLIEHFLQAEIHINASDSMTRSTCTYGEDLTPPKVEFDWHGTLKHDSTTTGIGSSAAKYHLAAENIAKQIADSLVKQFDELRKKHGPLPSIPDKFYPAFQSAEPLPFLGKWNAELLFTGHGLMNRNQSVWKFQSDVPPQEVLRTISNESAEDNWIAPTFQPWEQSLRIKRNRSVLEIFPDRASRTAYNLQGEFVGEAKQGPFTYYVTYWDRMQHQEILAACAALLDEEAAVETVVVFSRHWFGDRELEQRLLEYLQARSTTSLEALTATAKLLHRQKRDEEALQAMLAADALSETTSDPDKYKNRLKQLAETMKIEDFPPKTIDVELLRELGIRELKAGSKFMDLEFGLGEFMAFFYRDPNGKTRLYSLRAVPNGKNVFQLTYRVAARDEGFWQSSSGGMLSEDRWVGFPKPLDNTYSARFYALKLEGKPRFRVAVDVIDRNNPPPQLPYESPRP
ncbi:hypothetical protein Mal52_45610 [Symmachiella dynata]|uniref:Uncharacterized protein n=1 Tax=Symmachiella dynata TaxID=2527995 RepID=A0A517ZUB7_9PLAN|nr:hypothetical protein [Symmachiella dynata]QDU46064.1 hypothetical protein Mal52_45610 [Symmachiella dynata]